MRTEDDLFYFLQCATVASPRDDDWLFRVKEEKYALEKFSEYLRFLEGNEWFTLGPIDERATRWKGVVNGWGYEFDMEMVLKDAYPTTPPAVRIPELMKYTDRKLDDSVLGLRICDMHMEQNFWWDEHSGIALYLKREVSYWVQSVIESMKEKGWI
ncbi:MAG: hypothetical protein E3J35_11075 [Methanomassiliicoccales archaeon]|nr:MAG: hypothetical protein E3J35_11075 [Methanomassiliicoccales archaeon]